MKINVYMMHNLSRDNEKNMHKLCISNVRIIPNNAYIIYNAAKPHPANPGTK